MSPRVDQAARENLQFQGFGAELPDAAAAEPANAVRRFQVAVDVDRLVEIQHAVRTPAQGVNHVVGVLGAEAREDDPAPVRLAARLARGQVEQVGAIDHVDAPVARLQPGRDEQAVRENSGLVGLAGAGRVFEDDDLVVLPLARLDLWVRLAARDPEAASRVEIHLNGLGEQRVGREEIDLKAVRHLERAALDLRVGVRHLGVFLGAGAREPQCGKQEAERNEALHRKSLLRCSAHFDSSRFSL